MLGDKNQANMSMIEAPVMPEEPTEEAQPASRSGLLEKLHRIPFVARFSKHIPADKFGRYLLVGMGNTLFGFSTAIILNTVLTNVIPYSYIVASILASLFNWTVAYLGYKIFVFQTKGNYLREWSRCVVVYSSSLVINLILLPILVGTFHFTAHHMLLSADNIALLRNHLLLRRLVTIPNFAICILNCFSTIYSFLGHSLFSFRPRANSQTSPAQ